MLATTLKLKMSIVSEKEPVYLLTVAKGGARLYRLRKNSIFICSV
jgi:hypothetical protein